MTRRSRSTMYVMNNKLMKKKTMIAMSAGRFDSGMRVNGKAMKFKSLFPNLIKISHIMQPSGFRNFFCERNGFFWIDRQPEQTSGNKEDNHHIQSEFKMMGHLHDFSKCDGEKKSAHLSAKIHGTCNRPGIVPANVGTDGIGYHHTKSK